MEVILLFILLKSSSSCNDPALPVIASLYNENVEKLQKGGWSYETCIDAYCAFAILGDYSLLYCSARSDGSLN